MTPEEQAVQDKLPSLQYKLVCKDAFERNAREHKAIIDKLDLLIERQIKVREDLIIVQNTEKEQSKLMANQFKWLWWVIGGLGAVVGAIAKFFWDHVNK